MGIITERNKKRVSAGEMAAELPVPPQNMVIDINTNCNQKCVFCSFSYLRHTKYMEPALFYKIIEDAYRAGVREVGLSMSGEPFLHPHLNEFITRAKQIGYEYIFLSTNGMVKEIESYKEAIRCGLDSIKFSIHASSPERYQQIHGSDNFAHVISIVKDLSKWREEEGRKFYLFVFCAATRFTQGDGAQLKKVLDPFVDEVMLYSVTESSYHIKGIKEYLSVGQGTFDIVSPPCPYPFQSLSITVDGYLSACCEPYGLLNMADLSKMTIEEAWNCPSYQAFRRRMLKGDLAGLQCEHCMYGNRSGRIEPYNAELGESVDLSVFDATQTIKKRFHL